MKNYLLCIFLAVFTISIYGQNHKNAADYRTDAINGNAIAQFYLGQSYFRGWGIKPDTIQAVYWWRKSAEQGNPAAQNNPIFIFFFLLIVSLKVLYVSQSFL